MTVALRSNTWRLVTALLVVGGIGVASYLTYIHYHPGALVCTVGNCHAVQTSKYSKIGPVPVALLGLLMYLAVGGISIARWRRPELMSTLTMISFAIVLAGVVYAAYLTYLEINVINAICQWCVLTALITLGLLFSEGYGFYNMLE